MKKARTVRLRVSMMLSVLWTTSSLMRGGETASDQVRKRLADALQAQLPGYVETLQTRGPALGDAAIIERRTKMADSLFKEGIAHYKSAFSLAEPEAELLLRKGPDDAANLAAVTRNWETYKKAASLFPLPTVLKYLHQQVEAGVIQKGWDLELVRRVSDSHFATIMAHMHREESQKDAAPK